MNIGLFFRSLLIIIIVSMGINTALSTPAYAQMTEEECADLKKDIKDKEGEKKAAERDVKKKKAALTKAKAANKAYAKKWSKVKDRDKVKDKVKAKHRKMRKKLLAKFNAARTALAEAEATLKTRCTELEALKKQLEDECSETAPASVADTSVFDESIEADPWYDWMDWFYDELELMPDCDAVELDYTMYDDESGELCEADDDADDDAEEID